MPEFPERRPFSRVDFKAPAQLVQGGHTWSVQVLDISLKGTLLAMAQDQLAELDDSQPLDVQIRLDQNLEIDMHCRLAHRQPDRVGLSCVSIDLESIQHLRRLIELNLGDPTAMERELSELMQTSP